MAEEQDPNVSAIEIGDMRVEYNGVQRIVANMPVSQFPEASNQVNIERLTIDELIAYLDKNWMVVKHHPDLPSQILRLLIRLDTENKLLRKLCERPAFDLNAAQSVSRSPLGNP